MLFIISRSPKTEFFIFLFWIKKKCQQAEVLILKLLYLSPKYEEQNLLIEYNETTQGCFFFFFN